MRNLLPAIPVMAVLLLSASGVCKAQSSAKEKQKSKPKPAAKASGAGTASPAKGAAGAVGPAAPMPRVYAPTRPREVAPKYPWRKEIPTTVFWIGESPGENNPVPNYASSWDTNWQANYGGYDDPNRDARTWDFRPKAFTPGLNPFYVALPFNDLTNPEAAKKIPWYSQRKAAGASSVCKSVWLAVRAGNKTCFAQWEDCGPFTTSDHEYVFGGKPPQNKSNGGAGLDVSPAVRDFLNISSGALCDWRFCTDDEVPDGPWKRYGRSTAALPKEQKETDDLRKQYQELVRRREEWLQKQAAARTGP